MPKEFTMISRAKMAVHLEALKEHRVADRYTIADMAFLTGWTPNYLRILERRGRIPKAQRHDNTLHTRFWGEDAARAILKFKEKHGRFRDVD